MNEPRPLAPRAWLAAIAAALAIHAGAASGQPADRGRDWPAITREARPWTRWWWHGSAVERESLSAQLEALRDAGIGGVEITPIYGVRGEEQRFIQYLSSDWMRMLEHTLAEAGRLNLGVDMATGTGWPFGGPWVADDAAPRSVVHRTWTLAAGARLTEPIRVRQQPLVRAIGNQIHVVNEGAPGDPPRAAAAQPVIRQDARAIRIEDLAEPVSANRDLQSLALEQVKYPRDLLPVSVIARSRSGRIEDVTSRVGRDGMLQWTAPAGEPATVHALFLGWHGKLVERAAPGGEGNVIDHFSRDAVRSYLARFDGALRGAKLEGLRAFFNDSYEVDDATGQADWTPRLLEEFQRRRGYDLRQHLDALFAGAAGETSARVLADYRETLSDQLLDEFTIEWRNWARRHGAIVRNQSHGSPASLLDLYAASDIPETEGAEIQRFKWATSAAHVAGRRLVSAEAATWLGEHFRSTLADVRAALDRFFVAGVNHVVYHGTAYSPVREPWPGWLFYAAVAFSPQNAWWDDFGALNHYVARVQSFMQTGTPDHDVLLYYPLYDALAVRGNARLTHFGGAGVRPDGTAFDTAARIMQGGGFTYDFLSDRQLRATRVGRGALVTAGGFYRVLVLPQSRFVPLETFSHALDLARRGATVIAFKGWPSDVSGLANLAPRRRLFREAMSAVTFGPADGSGISEARVGSGRVLRGDDLASLLERAGIARETMVDRGLQFARRADAGGRIYFISNPTERPFDDWVGVAAEARPLTAFDPESGRRGAARVRQGAAGGREVYLQIPAGGSLILAGSAAPAREPFVDYRASQPPVPISGPWDVRFVKGGPTVPARRTIERLASWTTFGGDEVKSFSGSAIYTVAFSRPAGAADAWQIDLGAVRESARVRLNGRDAGTFIGPMFRLVVDDAALRPSNVLEVTVTNLSANRIADLDRRGVVWKKFYNVNFPARLPENRGPDGLFTAARWEPLDSGLLGPVTVTALTASK